MSSLKHVIYCMSVVLAMPERWIHLLRECWSYLSAARPALLSFSVASKRNTTQLFGSVTRLRRATVPVTQSLMLNKLWAKTRPVPGPRQRLMLHSEACVVKSIKFRLCIRPRNKRDEDCTNSLAEAKKLSESLFVFVF